MAQSPNIHQVRTRLVNSYVIEYTDKLMVMDVAVKCHRYVLGFIEHELRRDIAEVQLVICSHDDPDHIGGVFALAGLSNAMVGIPFASNLTLHKIRNNPYGGLVRLQTSLREAFRPRSWTMYVNPQRDRNARSKPKFTGQPPQDNKLRPQRADYRLRNGDPLPGFADWTVIHTPGHSWDSCCYYHPQSRSLLTGDTLLGSGKHSKLVVPSIYANARQTRETLQKLRNLDIEAVYPGHGSIIEGSDLIPASLSA